MAIVHLLPRFAAVWAIFLGSLTLIAAGVILIVHNPQGWGNVSILKYIFGGLFILFGIIFFAMLCIYRRRIKITGVFLDYASQFLALKPINLVFIPIFIILLAGLIILCLFEYLAFSSKAEPYSKEGDIYLQLTRNPILTILVIIQFIWGIQFLKDSCKFIFIQSILSSLEMQLNGTYLVTEPLVVTLLSEGSSAIILGLLLEDLSSMHSSTSLTSCSSYSDATLMVVVVLVPHFVHLSQNAVDVSLIWSEMMLMLI